MNKLNRWLIPEDIAQPTEDGGYGVAKQTQVIWRMEGETPYSKLSRRFIRYDHVQLNKGLENHVVVKGLR